MTAERRPRIQLPGRAPRQARGAAAEEAPEHTMEPDLTPEHAPLEQSVVDAALYRDGKRIESPQTVAEAGNRLREQTGEQPGAMAWIGLYRPEESQILALAEEFGLHEVAVEDAIVAHQRPKLERYDETLFVVLRAATYLDEVEEVEFGEIHVFVGMLDGLTAGFDKYGTDEELRRYVRDVHDHATTVAERVDGFRQMLSDILTVNATLVNQAQNEEIKALSEATYTQNEQVKRISAWAAILFAPTLIGTIYGMNFADIPGLRESWGFALSVGLMLGVSVLLFVIFKRRGWL